MDEIRALTVRQPYAGAIIWGGKRTENRPRTAKYRGRILVHAGLHHSDWAEFREVNDLSRLTTGEGLNWLNTRAASKERLERERYLPRTTSALGVILGSAELVDCHHGGDCGNRCSAWARPECWHWQLRDVRPLASPVPCKGRLGLWRLPADIEKAVRDQLAEVPRGGS